ncbi:Secreted protein OS=Tsukamurella paurometabola (strain ATCC 8368 / DSM / CCUG 35730 / CIP 100753/ JCM 10117 / KCTC 9821 / NBRC 16120 / NCIMB 702349 / NCTC 13040) OX=521096 GN=Tpau_3578 PE=4 SV=1 [Tsukamurella paurometabola]|uniref:Secreted protein n=1 Tax=Tsukamurella paurometabola (strain ATCC 8368 / DSM 20162 / CCUG 35730 / CIP 100753 / JCM 10117 / KCTC 9821 / NBRC 16120 / NCIMB 702349 / NCTC 13040) TaxID=521096 RepID=D5UXR9_TSUPD|nr:hypothetical protein [Tsukamurella paurometabola]ADG80156.1 hypothetical protein Tpau_3578 [Tsukamurella paurometabola DSM 20162]SUP38636.1 Uncharacterised protein [Tsukamurella paurometabola]
MHALRRSAVVVAALAIAAPAGVAQAAPAPAPGKPATPAAQLLLTQAEFPAGYEVQQVSAKDLADVLRDVGSGLNKAKVTPAHCAPVVNRADFERSSKLPLVVGVNKAKKAAISEVLAEGQSIDKALANPAGCDKVRVEMNDIAGTKDRVVLDITSTPVNLPGAPAGSKAVLATSTGTVTVDGKAKPIKQEQLLAGANVRGYALLITGSGAGPNPVADRDGVAKALATGINKVRTAR